MKTKLAALFVAVAVIPQLSHANVDSKSAKVDIKIIKVECLKQSPKSKGYVATAQVKKALEGSSDSEIKIFFDTNKKDAVSFLEGDEAVVTLHKESKYWVINSPEDKKGSVFSAGMLPNCH